MLVEVGTVIEGKVTGITKFGAFVALPGGKSGMVHISEVANAFVNDIHDHLSEGQTVKVKVIGITPEGKINLSIKKAVEQPAETRPGTPERRAETTRQQGGERAYSQTERMQHQNQVSTQPFQGVVAPKSSDISFEDKLKQFMQESDSKISGSKIYEQPRKSSRRRRD